MWYYMQYVIRLVKYTNCKTFGFRKERRDPGLSVVIDSRRQQPVPALLSSLSELQVSPPWKICNYPPTHPKSFRTC